MNSTMPAVVLRVKDTDMAVRIPYGRHRHPHLFLHDLTGKGSHHPVWDDTRAAWLLPRRHAETVLLGLARRFHEVTVYQYGDPAVLCRSSCQNAQSSVPACECSCAGAGHGIERRPTTRDAAMARTGTILGARVGVAAAFVAPGFDVQEVTLPTQTEHGVMRHYIVRSVGEASPRPVTPAMADTAPTLAALQQGPRSLELTALAARQRAEATSL